ncbi:MAG: polysaccharide biosynthesis C-terminal domain-containing protein [Bacteroidota bacterium]
MIKKTTYQDNLKRDTLKYLPVKILPAIVGLLTIFFLTRSLSTTVYANYSFIIATILIFSQLISGWVNSAVLFFFPDYDKNGTLERLKVDVVRLQSILYAIGAIGFSIVIYIGLRELTLVLCALFLLFAQTFLNLLYSFLQAERRVLVQIKSTSIQSIVQLLGIFCCYLYCPNDLGFVILVLFLSYFAANIYVIYADKMFGLIIEGFFSQLKFEGAKKILYYGLPICLWFFASQFYAVGDRILLKYFNVNFLAGNYASFRDLAVGVSGFITMPLLMASHPIIVQMWKSGANKKEIENVVSQNIMLLTTLFTPFFIALFLLGQWIMNIVVGDAYLLENYLMILVLASIFFGTVSMYLHKGLEVTGKTLVMAKMALVTAIFSFVGNCFFIPEYGVKGVCIVAVLSQLLYCVLIYNLSRKAICIKIPILFIVKHVTFVLLAFMYSKIFIENSILDLVMRFVILSCFTIYLFTSSSEVRAMIKLIKA